MVRKYLTILYKKRCILNMKNIRLSINPFYLYSIILSIIMIIYNLKWSNLYPSISNTSYIFYILTILISMACGLLYKIKFKHESRKNKNIINIGKFTILIWVGHILEFIYSGVIPFIEISIKKTSYIYKNYTGIPTFHVILVTFNSFFAIYIFHRYLIEKNKKYLLYFIINLIPAMLIYNRAMVVLIFISCASVYIYERFDGKITLKSIFILAVLGIAFIYLFGISGNIRSNRDYKIDDNRDSSYIMLIGNASNEFRNSIIPKPFFWGYIYSTSSLANLEQTFLTNYNHKINVQSMVKFINSSILPDFIAKRIDSMLDIEYKESYEQVSPNLTVSAFYANSFVNLGWLGVILLFLYLVFFIFMYRILLDKDSCFFITGISMLNTIVIFNFFSNSFTFSGLSFQLIYPLIFSILMDKKYIYKLKNRFE